MPQTSPYVIEDIALFAQIGPLRTWSVVVTVMGDLLRTPGQGISGKELAALVGALGISDQALRVAVHRLKKDGWIESRREGRESKHFLTERARRETEAVRGLIYDASSPDIGPVSLVVAPPNLAEPLAQRLPERRSAVLSARSALVSGDLPDVDFLRTPVDTQALPGWVRDVLAPRSLRDEFTALRRAVIEALERVPDSEAHRKALRLVILHHWRRTVLRQSPLAEALLGPDWEGAQTRQVVLHALKTL
ncbi:PaaX family transcriptional regulator C-terminal domain-containing protein [Tropicibacter sp. S64]|uniref:PaaX family transcriptional regulator C-terminal domain-containing protein n=1 Tax=Tropicibacter sp. S64 TaxID=3415122 RepID=UPI003C7E19E2